MGLAEAAQQFVLARARHAEYVGALDLGDLHREVADAARSSVSGRDVGHRRPAACSVVSWAGLWMISLMEVRAYSA
ncbi:hypothetical protein ACIRJM_04510 [Streptomyces sp. NPDC102405]|uniref:hypothetical protein n=1 Tax=Streptomyces sp. NPDC102405 TaxID=3366170 RepID=UPI0037FF6207